MNNEDFSFCLCGSYHSGNCNVLGTLCQEWEEDQMYIVLIKNHRITLVNLKSVRVQPSGFNNFLIAKKCCFSLIQGSEKRVGKGEKVGHLLKAFTFSNS